MTFLKVSNDEAPRKFAQKKEDSPVHLTLYVHNPDDENGAQQDGNPG